MSNGRSLWAGGEESGELCLGEHALVRTLRVWSFVSLEPVERMRGEIAAAKREREERS
jgi:hypothetical protein